MFVKLNINSRLYKFNVKLTTLLSEEKVDTSLYSRLDKLTKLSKSFKHGTAKQELVAAEIKSIRDILKDTVSSKYRVTAMLGQKLIQYDYAEPVDAEEIRTVCKELSDALLSKRKKHKESIVETKNFLGFQYATVGGVFQKANAVVTIAQTNNPRTRIDLEKVPPLNKKDHYVGIELEFASKCDRDELKELFIKAGLAGRVHVGNDGSIGCEGDHRHAIETRILCKQTEVKDIVTRACAVLNGPTVNALVNATTGMHVHLDMRNRDTEKAYNNLVQIQPLLFAMLPTERKSSSYCKENNTSDLNVELRSGDRYKAINACSISRRKTLECRLHTGTTNAAKIINWVSILASAVDHPTKITEWVKSASDFMQVNTNSKLGDYIDKRVALFSKGSTVTTKEDHLNHANFDVAV